jgi:sugar lactone lactonase YvrE
MKKPKNMLRHVTRSVLRLCFTASLIIVFGDALRIDSVFGWGFSQLLINRKKEEPIPPAPSHVAVAAVNKPVPVVAKPAAVLPPLPAVILPPSCLKTAACHYTISTVAGNGNVGNSGDNAPATSATFAKPAGLALDRYNNLFVIDFNNKNIRKIDGKTNTIHTVVNDIEGSAIAVDSSDNIFALGNGLRKLAYNTSNNMPVVFQDSNNPVSYGLAVDEKNNAYYTDAMNSVVQKINLVNLYPHTTIGGTIGEQGYEENGLTYDSPHGIAVDKDGNIYVVDTDNHVVRKLTYNDKDSTYTTSVIAGVAGHSGYSGDNGLASYALLNAPQGIALDAVGNVYIADTGNQVVRVVSSATNLIATIAGVSGKNGYTGDNAEALASQLNKPVDLIVDRSGNIYVVDQENVRIRKLAPKNPPPHIMPPEPKSSVPPPSCVLKGKCEYIISTVAGNGNADSFGDDGLATEAALNWPSNIALDLYDNVFVVDSKNENIRKIDGTNKKIKTIEKDIVSASIATDKLGNIWSIDNDWHVLRVLFANSPSQMPIVFQDPNGVMSYGIAVDSENTIYYTDAENHLVQKITKIKGSYILSTIGGTKGQSGYEPSGQFFNNPRGIAVDVRGNVYVADTNNHVVRKLTLKADGSGYVFSLIAGTSGKAGFDGDNKHAQGSLLNAPQGVAIDTYGNIFIADTGNHVVRMISASNIITTIAGIQGKSGYVNDNTLGKTTLLNSPTGLVIDKLGNIYVSDQANSRVRKLIPQNSPPPVPFPLPCVEEGTCHYAISTFAEIGNKKHADQMLPPKHISHKDHKKHTVAVSSPSLESSFGIALDRFKNLFVFDPINKNMQRFDGLSHRAQTIVSNMSGSAVATDASDNIFAIDNGSHVLRRFHPKKSNEMSVITQTPPDAVSHGITIDNYGNIYFTDAANHLVQKIKYEKGEWLSEMIGGSKGQSGYDSLGTMYNNPRGIAVDKDGNIYVADTNNHVIRKIIERADGLGYVTSIVAGIPGKSGYSGDNESALKAMLNAPESIAVDLYNNIYIADTGNHVVRMISSAQDIIKTIAGTPDNQKSQKGIVSPNVLGVPKELIVDKSGNVYVTDQANNRVQKLIPQATSYWCHAEHCDKAKHQEDAACFISSSSPARCIYGTLEFETVDNDDDYEDNKNEDEDEDEEDDEDEDEDEDNGNLIEDNLDETYDDESDDNVENDDMTAMEKCLSELQAVCGGFEATFDKYKNVSNSSCSSTRGHHSCVSAFEH